MIEAIFSVIALMAITFVTVILCWRHMETDREQMEDKP